MCWGGVCDELRRSVFRFLRRWFWRFVEEVIFDFILGGAWWKWLVGALGIAGAMKGLGAVWGGIPWLVITVFVLLYLLRMEMRKNPERFPRSRLAREKAAERQKGEDRQNLRSLSPDVDRLYRELRDGKDTIHGSTTVYTLRDGLGILCPRPSVLPELFRESGPFREELLQLMAAAERGDIDTARRIFRPEEEYQADPPF